MNFQRLSSKHELVEGDLTSRYLAASVPDAIQVAGLRLHPFTLGHAHLLAAAIPRWRPLESGLEIEDLPAALFILSRPWRKAARRLSGSGGLFVWRLGLHLRSTRRIVEAFTLLNGWLTLSCSGPEAKAVQRSPREQAAPPRRIGAPLLLRLRLFATQELGAAEPFDFLVSELLWLWLSYFEAEGSATLVSDADMNFREWCEEQDRLRTRVN